MDKMYNLFFYPNTCHTCKCFGKDVNLKRCSNCKMISYCSKEHQKKHWPEHKNLCTAICTVKRNNRVTHLFCGSQNIDSETWAQMKMNLMLLVAIQLNRKLELYEEQMFKFQRACAVCHESSKLQDCPHCPAASFCEKHISNSEHKVLCSELKLSFDLDSAYMNFQHQIPEIIPYCADNISLPNSMKAFIERYVKKNRNSQMSLIQEICYSECLTRPLTVLYIVQALKYMLQHNEIIVHVIAANMNELNGIEIWETILHWLPELTFLRIVLIGPELSWAEMEPDLCRTCSTKNKKLLVEICGTFYDVYRHNERFTKPSLVVGFNAGIHEFDGSSQDTWTASLKVLSQEKCPVALTAYTRKEAEKEQQRLTNLLGNIECDCCIQNPYSSLRPYRDYETEGIYYQNNYLILYRRLCTS